MLIHRHREDPVSISEAAQEIGRAVLDEYGGALSSESMILRHGQIVGLPPGTYRKLLRAIRRGVRATKGCLPST